MSEAERAQTLFFAALDLLDARDFAGAEPLLREALALVPDRGSALTNLAIVLLRQNKIEEAETVAQRAATLAPDDPQCWLTLGAVLARTRHLDDALAATDRAVTLAPHDPQALAARAAILNTMKRFDAAIADLVKALAIDPALPDARANLVGARMRACDWTNLAADTAALLEQLRAGAAAFNPFILLAMPSTAADQLLCAQRFVSQSHPSAPPLYRGERYDHRRIRIAYISGDFREHPTAQLLAGVFEHHDRAGYETFGVSFGPDDGSAIRARLMRGFDRFIDVRGRSDADIAELVRAEEIDIAVDLGVFTNGGRPGIFARRPAPVQVNYLVYPGTSGAPYIDYIIADATVIPAEERRHYSETVVWLPRSFFAGDDRRAIAETVPTRAEEGLPESGFVFGSFNNSYKITPDIFDVWMRLLREVEGSVLWLIAGNDLVPANLRREAQMRGIAPERLVLAKKLPVAQHLARQRLADLLLDTPLYNAHTTASDALWAGVPLLTLTGSTFAGRVATSILAAMDLPELITRSPAEYAEVALRLARDPQGLAALRTKIAAKRTTSPVFDTARLTRNLEAAYATMVERVRRGLPAEAFSVGALTANP